MASYHIVQQGEHLSSISKKYGFSNYRTVWEHPENKSVKDKRKNPNVLFPGDRLYIPDKEEKKEVLATGKRHRFEVNRPSIMLRLFVRNLDSQPIADTECQLEVDGQLYTLTTDGRGRIEQSIPITAQTGKLTIRDLVVPLKIGHLDPLDEVSGWIARLNNLGYKAGNASDSDDPQLRFAIEEFQCDYGLEADGICGPKTQAKLKEIHGC
jgi:hypothetical protein